MNQVEFRYHIGDPVIDTLTGIVGKVGALIVYSDDGHGVLIIHQNAQGTQNEFWRAVKMVKPSISSVK